MLKNYLTIAFRALSRQFTYSFINIAGLAVGLACSLTIFLYVFGEWSHDRHFANADRIYRIGISFFNMGNFAKGTENVGIFLPQEYDGIEAITSFDKDAKEKLTIEDRTFSDLVYYVDSSFFKVFSYEFKVGDPIKAVEASNSAILTESISRKYFGTDEVVGKTIELGKQRVPYHITAVVKDDDRPSHLKGKVWVTMPVDREKKIYWTSASVYTYILLKENFDQQSLSYAMDRLISKRVFPTSGWKSLEEYKADENSVKFYIQPFKEIYLKSKLILEVSPGGNEAYMIIFAVIAIFILTLAVVNFVNLSTARATRRAKEIGIRKSLGTTRNKLIGQFLLESMLVSTLAMVIALGLAELFAFGFFWITGQNLAVSLWSGVYGFAGILAFTVITGLLSGIYPALFLTRFQPAKVLKGNVHTSGSGGFRNALVVFQFSISITLIICTVVIIRQLNYIATKDLGFDQKNIVTVENLYLAKPGAAIAFRNEMLQSPDVLDATLHSGEPGSKAVMTFNTFFTPEMKNALTIQTYFADENFLNVMGIKLVKGRNFNKDLASDSSSVIFNEAALKALNISDDPIGQRINEHQAIIGVVNDFHWESLRSPIGPLAIILRNERSKGVTFSQLAIKLRSSRASEVLGKARALWTRISDDPMEYHFMDENFGDLLEKEQVFGKAIAFFTGLAIVISCLGLFGLAAYTTEQRTKEIGIRKVLGATAANIVIMLNRQFTRLVIISLFFAVPASLYVGREWLSGFAYRTDLDVWIFASGAVTGLVISIFTVAFHSLRASKTNPAETLKCE